MSDKLAYDLIVAGSGPATGALTKWGREKYEKFIAISTKALAEYANESLESCKNVKNILYRDQTAITDEKYVNVSFAKGNKTSSDLNLVSALMHKRHILIKGRGGAGKTMFTKWAVLRLNDQILHHQQIPIYIELREIRSEKDFDHFEDYLFDKISNYRTRTSKFQFLEGLKAGLFVFVLDAVDEIGKNYRTKILQKIHEFERRYPEVGILLTSREFAEIEGLHGFETYITKPLSEKQALQILSKLDYRSEVRDALISEIKQGKYKKHKFFLENPLLVTILLLTFDQSRYIPTKRSAFYKRAFETLYERHDTSKNVGFSRDHHAGLPMDEFEEIFSLFCYGTYINSAYSFSETELVRNFKIALNRLSIDEKAHLVARDAIESVCLLVKEGHEVVFVHRSFQEYFTALYIKNYKEIDIGDVIEEAVTKGIGELTLEFIFELDKFSLEKHYILPRLKTINTKARPLRFSEKKDRVKALGLLFKEMTISEKTGNLHSLLFSENVDQMFLQAITPLYPEANILRVFSSKGFDLRIFESVPTAKLQKNRSCKVEQFSNGETFYRVKFTPTSEIWLDGTNIFSRIHLIFEDLKKLEDRLEAIYRVKPTQVRSRFSDFAAE